MTLDAHIIEVMNDRIGIDISENRWVEQALTTRSYFNEHPTQGGHNQPLATLGDAVIRLLVMNELFIMGERDKGVMTQKAENYVKGTMLTRAAQVLKLHDLVIWGKGDVVEEIWNKGGILGECLEALFGAVFLEKGLEACYKVYKKVLPCPSSTLIGETSKKEWNSGGPSFNKETME